MVEGETTMTRQDGRGRAPRVRKWTSRAYYVLGAVALIAVCTLVRQMWKPQAASAQAPERQPATAAAAQPPKTPTNQPAPAGQVPQVVASVNGEQITRQQLADEGEMAFPGHGRLPADQERVRQLERENEILRQERDILKKAIAIFSRPRP
jgi:hypothetical protein